MRNWAAVLLFSFTAQGMAAQEIVPAHDPSFGHALDLNGHVLAIGAPAYAQGRGGVWIYMRTGARWEEVFHGYGSNGDSLGFSVALDDRWLLAGAPGAQRACWFVRIGDRWQQAHCTQLRRSGFGRAVALSGVFSAVGSPDHDWQRGATDLFVQSSPSVWSHQATLVGEAQHSAFGATLAMNSETLLVGAPLSDEPRGRDAGLVFVYDRTAGSDWVEQAVLTASNAGNGHQFGHAAAITNYQEHLFAVIGAPQIQTSYLFVRTDDAWLQTDAYRPAPIAPSQRLGLSVDVHQNTAVVGSPSDLPNQPGTTWILDIDEFLNWYPGDRLQNGPSFGSSVKIDDQYIAVAEPGRAVYGFQKTALSQEPFPIMPNPLTAYPNPFNGQITIEISPIVQAVKIWDLAGRLVETIKANSHSQLTWRPRNLAPGIYVVTAMGQTTQIVHVH